MWWALVVHCSSHWDPTTRVDILSQPALVRVVLQELVQESISREDSGEKEQKRAVLATGCRYSFYWTGLLL